MVGRDLTIDYFKDKLEMEGNRLDILAIVAEKAKVKLKGKEKLPEYVAAAEEAQAKTQTTRPKRRRETSLSYDGEAESSKRRKCKPYSEDNTPPPLPEKFENLILEIARGKVLTPPTLVIQKFLFKSDVNPYHNRFNIPICQIVRDDFLTDDEKRLIQTYFDTDIHMKKKKKKKKNNNNNNKNNNNKKNKKKNKKKKEIRRKKYIEVKMIEPSLNLETVKLCQWNMEKTNGGKTSSNYVINGNWSHIVSGNNLTEEMEVQLWCFRLDQDLYFALVPLP